MSFLAAEVTMILDIHRSLPTHEMNRKPEAVSL